MGKINMATSTINTLLALVQSAFNSNVLQIQYGGTGTDSLNALRANLGLGNDVNAPLPVEKGGTGVGSLSALKGAILSGNTGAIGVEAGGTGRDNLTNNSVICGNGTGQVNMVSATEPGVLQVAARDTLPFFDTVPVSLGGTGVKTKSLLSNLLGLGGGTEDLNDNVTYDAIPVERGGTGKRSYNDISKELNLGDTTSDAIPMSRGGTGVTAYNRNELLTNIGAVNARGDSSLTGGFVLDGTLQIKNSNTGLTLYNLSDRLQSIETRLQALESRS